MEYRKPEINLVDRAARAIQGLNKKFRTLLLDSLNIIAVTLLAYEADE
jgi:hypothetical protein